MRTKKQQGGNFFAETATVKAKMATMKWGSLAWENLGKGSDWIKVGNLGNPGKGLVRWRAQHKPRKN